MPRTRVCDNDYHGNNNHKPLRADLKVLSGLADVHDDDANEDVGEDEVAQEDEGDGVEPAQRHALGIQDILYVCPSVHLSPCNSHPLHCHTQGKRQDWLCFRSLT